MALFVLVVAVSFLLTVWVCMFVCRWAANSGFAVEVNRKYLHKGKSAT
jgi:hypothetical protein